MEKLWKLEDRLIHLNHWGRTATVTGETNRRKTTAAADSKITEEKRWGRGWGWGVLSHCRNYRQPQAFARTDKAWESIPRMQHNTKRNPSVQSKKVLKVSNTL